MKAYFYTGIKLVRRNYEEVFFHSSTVSLLKPDNYT